MRRADAVLVLLPDQTSATAEVLQQNPATPTTLIPSCFPVVPSTFCKPLQTVLRPHSAQLPVSGDTHSWAAKIAMAVTCEHESTPQSLAVETIDVAQVAACHGAAKAGGAVPAGDSDSARVQVVYDVHRFSVAAAAVAADMEAPECALCAWRRTGQGEKVVK